ncbi:hypothetical protein SUGI_0761700 [Cryptomeria japonica]|nr:hypothetical protein SUGI_0761700 [Cryptomeria japonica]
MPEFLSQNVEYPGEIFDVEKRAANLKSPKGWICNSSGYSGLSRGQIIMDGRSPMALDQRMGAKDRDDPSNPHVQGDLVDAGNKEVMKLQTEEKELQFHQEDQMNTADI